MQWTVCYISREDPEKIGRTDIVLSVLQIL